MNDTQLLERLSAANAYGDDLAVPESVWTRDLALREIERRTGMTQTTSKTTPVEPHRPRRRGVLIAVAAFAAILVVGGAAWLAANRDDERPPSDQAPATSTTEAVPTTQPQEAIEPSTSTVPTTAPEAVLGESFFTGWLPAGSYAAARFPVPMVFDLDEGWSALGEDPLGGLFLATSEIVCTPDCEPVDGVAVVIRQIEGTPDELATTFAEQLGSPGTITGVHLVASEMTTGTYAGFDAVTVDYTMDDGLDDGAVVPVLWPYNAEQPGIKPLIFAGDSRTVFVDAGIGHTLVVHHPHADASAEAAIAARVEELMATGVRFMAE